uniref:Pyruvate kinase C-terminal domain-containing protein n=1 Tax=Candidatus Kentrum sp. TUN TaxID=2126343 RepID=A0A450ZL46_9GAMM|nr:MAG: hypothetical protein BECKTUN1418F_GA0071002_104513 [Candidatus Kentron sp. TUN]VFK57123.1 MAG: hypothetical protein BECKTUN1418E_GA0071001_104413 [Candidatus Kentron sp. TUN]VFK57907.1 MAG: hypothetical protein BECKTUN1418D_GA0071000_107112 [Candidatus Kentron sp. TUN]
MTTKQILYFDRPGPQNTDALIRAVKERVLELGIKHVVVASISGQTGLKFWEALQETGCTLISVTEHAGFHGKDEVALSPETREEMEKKGIKTLIAAHALSGVGRSISKQFGGVSHLEIVSHTLRRFGGEGIKVAVEVSIMAADAGLLPTDREVIAVGGTHEGADAAIVLKGAHMNNFFDLEIREIIAKSRQRVE